MNVADRAREFTATTGTGTVTLAGAAPGFRSFSESIGFAASVYYCISSRDGLQWEIGEGTFTPPAALSRDRVLSSSSGLSKVNFTAGDKDVFINLPAEMIDDWMYAPTEVVLDTDGVSVIGFTVGGVGSTVSYADATMTVSTPGAPDVVLDGDQIFGNAPDPVTFTPSLPDIAFSAFFGANPAPVVVKLNASDRSAVPFTVSDNAAWLTVSPTSGTTGVTEITATVDNAALLAGTVTGTISFGVDGQTITVPVSNEVKALAVTREIRVSTLSTRANSVPLAGQTITGNQFVFVPDDADIQSIDFFLNPASTTNPTGTPFHTENATPWDFNGLDVSGTGAAAPYDFSAAPVSSTVVARIFKKSGGNVVISAAFTRGGSAPVPGTLPKKKFVPGHLIRPGRNFGGVQAELDSMKDGSTYPGFKGLLMILDWSNIETSLGVFNWAQFDTFMAQCAAARRYGMVQVNFTSFGAYTGYWPSYLFTSAYSGGYCTQYNGTDPATRTVRKQFLKISNAAVRGRIINFIQQFAAKYDKNPWFLGWSFEEAIGPSAMTGKSLSNVADVVGDDWIDGWKAIFTAADAAFVNSNWYYKTNWQSFVHTDKRTDVQHYLEHVNSLGGGLSWPDTTPGIQTYASPLVRGYRGILPMLAGVENGVVIGYLAAGTMTYASILAYGTTDAAGFKAQNMVWDGWTVTSGAFTYSSAGVKDFVKAQGYPINTAVPSTLTV